jgi:NAD(P)-dependent dehydrogenase (short-subunit alcohol dehydrogenase family)
MRDFWSKRNYSFENIPDLTGKIAIITGSNSGVSILLFFLLFCHVTHLLHKIGKVCALEMARKGCTVYVLLFLKHLLINESKSL